MVSDLPVSLPKGVQLLDETAIPVGKNCHEAVFVRTVLIKAVVTEATLRHRCFTQACLPHGEVWEREHSSRHEALLSHNKCVIEVIRLLDHLDTLNPSEVWRPLDGVGGYLAECGGIKYVRQQDGTWEPMTEHPQGDPSCQTCRGWGAHMNSMGLEVRCQCTMKVKR